MAKIRVRPETGTLYLDFFVNGIRCREQTLLEDSASNRARLEKLLNKIEQDLAKGTFDYSQYFPNSPRAKVIQAAQAEKLTSIPSVAKPIVESLQVQAGVPTPAALREDLPYFHEFAHTWQEQNKILWRRTHQRTIDDILKLYLLPEFAGKRVGQITKSDILNLRTKLAKVPGRKGDTLSGKRINAIMAPLRQILNEAADVFEFTTTYRNIKPLKEDASDIHPLTLAEVQLFLQSVRIEYRDYYTVAFFTGMRTGELNGLKWSYVDFEKRQLLIRETVVAGEEDKTKTDGSRREIHMSEVVYQALQRQHAVSARRSAFVFPNKEGKPLDHNNVTKRIWYPTLKMLGLEPRRPYQTRHTCATLWLAAGENPLWIARQLGHVSTEMLFKVYGRFVPNLTRQDGSAFERLLLQSGTVGSDTPAANDPDRGETNHG